jgi:hypothetical protein
VKAASVVVSSGLASQLAKPRPATPRFWRASDVQVSAAVARREAKSNDA